MPTGNNKHFPGKCPTPTSAVEQIDSLITHNRGRPGAFRHSQVSQSGEDGMQLECNKKKKKKKKWNGNMQLKLEMHTGTGSAEKGIQNSLLRFLAILERHRATSGSSFALFRKQLQWHYCTVNGMQCKCSSTRSGEREIHFTYSIHAE